LYDHPAAPHVVRHTTAGRYSRTDETSGEQLILQNSNLFAGRNFRTGEKFQNRRKIPEPTKNFRTDQKFQNRPNFWRAVNFLRTDETPGEQLILPNSNLFQINGQITKKMKKKF